MLPHGGRREDVDDEDVLRARFYGLLAELLAGPPDANGLRRWARLEGDETPIGEAIGNLAVTASQLTPDRAEREFNRLFIGLTGGELTPYGSYYLTGFVYEKPLADLRWDMEALGIARADGVAEPEDHIASVCEIMRGLITGAFGPPASLRQQRRFFDAHVAPWASRFFEDLETAPAAVLYRPIGALGRLFMAVEREAFSMIGDR